jgi:hypothetical protein
VQPHNFMDDLESFFYVLCHVTFLYNQGHPMKSASRHEILSEWTLSPRISAKSKSVFSYEDGLPFGVIFMGNEKAEGAFYTLLRSLCEIFRQQHADFRKAFTQDPRSRTPMKHLSNWEEYKTAAKEAYDKFLGPVNIAIDELKSIDPNWASALSLPPPPPLLDSGAPDIDADLLPPESPSAGDSSDWPQAGGSLSIPHAISAQTSRSSSKRPHSVISDDSASLEYSNAGASGSGARGGRDSKRTKE